MRIRDWSADVCSSDLCDALPGCATPRPEPRALCATAARCKRELGHVRRSGREESFPLLFRHPREKRGLISRSCNTRNTWEMGSRFRGNDGRMDRENSEIHFRKSLVAPRLACFDARHEDAPPPDRKSTRL